jgi:hypothetical protein
MDCHAEETSIPAREDIRGEVCEARRRGIREVVEDENLASILSHEDATVGRETDQGGVAKTSPRQCLLKARREILTTRRLRNG